MLGLVGGPLRSLVSYMPLAISTNFAKRSALNHEQKFTRWLSVAQEQAPGVR